MRKSNDLGVMWTPQNIKFNRNYRNMNVVYKKYLLVIALVVFGCSDELNDEIKFPPTISVLESENRFVFQEYDTMEFIIDFSDEDGFIRKIDIIANKSQFLLQDSSSSGLQSPYVFSFFNSLSHSKLPIGIQLIEVIVYDDELFASKESLLIEIIEPVAADLN